MCSGIINSIGKYYVLDTCGGFQKAIVFLCFVSSTANACSELKLLPSAVS